MSDVIEIEDGEDTFDIFKTIEDIDLEDTQKVTSNSGEDNE